jgi:hypothetical protein
VSVSLEEYDALVASEKRGCEDAIDAMADAIVGRAVVSVIRAQHVLNTRLIAYAFARRDRARAVEAATVTLPGSPFSV